MLYKEAYRFIKQTTLNMWYLPDYLGKLVFLYGENTAVKLGYGNRTTWLITWWEDNTIEITPHGTYNIVPKIERVLLAAYLPDQIACWLSPRSAQLCINPRGIHNRFHSQTRLVQPNKKITLRLEETR